MDYKPLLNARDVAALMKLIVGNILDEGGEDGLGPGDYVYREENADYNLDGKVNAKDVTQLMKHIVGAKEPMEDRIGGGVQRDFYCELNAALAALVVPDVAEAGEKSALEMSVDDFPAFVREKLSQFDAQYQDGLKSLFGLYAFDEAEEDDADENIPGDGDYPDFSYEDLMKLLGLSEPTVIVLDGFSAKKDGVTSLFDCFNVINDPASKKTVAELSETVVDCDVDTYEPGYGLFDDWQPVFSTEAAKQIGSYHLAVFTFPGVTYDQIDTRIVDSVKLSDELEDWGYIINDPEFPVPDPSAEAHVRAFTGEMLSEIWFNDFAYEESAENVVISPLSVAIALAMAANGAEGETAAYFERLFGDRDELNETLAALVKVLGTEDGAKMAFADSVWIRQGVTVLEDYLAKISRYYEGGVFTDKPFDTTTTGEVKSWVSDNTLGLIKKLVSDDDIAAAALLILNAVGFKADWATPFDPAGKGQFTCDDGSVSTVDMMSGTAERYLDIGVATGFIKEYAGGKYGFMALLPQDPDEFFAQLGDGFGETDLAELGFGPGEAEREMLNMTVLYLSSIEFGEGDLKQFESSPTAVTMPKFKTEYSLSFVEEFFPDGVLADPFDPSRADFSGITGTKELYIDDVIHKATIDVNENGTSAAAATAVVFEKNAAPYSEHQITLDRPFVYAIIDMESGIPVFIGVTATLDNAE